MNKIFLFSLLHLMLISCQPVSKESHINNKKTTFDYSTFNLKPGDILFQDSDCGPFCESIEKVTEGVDGSAFSHVAMVIPTNSDELKVIEAVTAGVIITSLDTLFMRSFDDDNNSKVVVGRMKPALQHLIPGAINYAKTKLGLEYDDVFDISNNKFYCSELIYESFKAANNNQPIFKLQKMTYVDPETGTTFPVWEAYFRNLNVPIPEGKPGLNPGGMSMSEYIDIVHFYGKPEGYKG